MFRRIFTKKVLLWLMLAFMLGTVFPAAVLADTTLKATVSDPDNPQGQGGSEGNTINTVLSSPTVSAGANRELGTIRIIGKPGIAVPVQPGQKVMLTLPTGLAYMQTANSSNYQNYVEWPEMLNGEKNQIFNQDGLPGVKFIAANPHSLTLELLNIDSSAKVFALDFIFNRENYSTVRVAPFVEVVEEYRAEPDGNLSRVEFFKLLSGIMGRFSPALVKVADAQVEMFSDAAVLEPADLADIKPLIEAGLLRGNGASLLRPNDYISRAEAASLLGRAFPARGDWAVFSDPIPAWAKADINSAFASGLINGYADGSFKANKLLNKSEAITLLQRSLESYSNKPLL